LAALAAVRMSCRSTAVKTPVTGSRRENLLSTTRVEAEREFVSPMSSLGPGPSWGRTTC
jgi:hypothetical protein